MTLFNRNTPKAERLSTQLLTVTDLKQIVGGVEENGGIVRK